MSAQEAHHIIPVGVFENIMKDNILYNRIEKVFGQNEFINFQQMGNNFIYLYKASVGWATCCPRGSIRYA